MIERYIGIEQELTSFIGTEEIAMDDTEEDYFSALKSRKDHHISETSIRTATGNGYYCDGSELEIVTPPIAINKGFATRLTDSLIIGRNHVITRLPDMKHTGYSMHWNLSEAGSVNPYMFFLAAGIPFSLFAQTPLSEFGVGMRSRGEIYNQRIELLGDSIINEEQINATALLLGSASQAVRTKNFVDGRHPGFCAAFEELCMMRPLLTNVNFRDAQVTVSVPSEGTVGRTTAQEYLEKFYTWLKPYAVELGTHDEVRNLEDFVFGKKKLEVDKENEYLALEEDGWFEDGTYLPPSDDYRYPVSPVLRFNRGMHDVPLEGRLLGEVATGTLHRPHQLNWNSAKIAIPTRMIARMDNHLRSLGVADVKYTELQYGTIPETVTIVHVETIKGIYHLGTALAYEDGRKLTYTPSLDLAEIKPNPIEVSFVEAGDEVKDDLSRTLLLTDRKKTVFPPEPKVENTQDTAWLQGNRMEQLLERCFNQVCDIIEYVDDVLHTRIF